MMPPKRTDARGQTVEQVVDRSGDRLGIAGLAHAGEAPHVGEHDGQDMRRASDAARSGPRSDRDPPARPGRFCMRRLRAVQLLDDRPQMQGLEREVVEPEEGLTQGGRDLVLRHHVDSSHRLAHEGVAHLPREGRTAGARYVKVDEQEIRRCRLRHRVSARGVERQETSNPTEDKACAAHIAKDESESATNSRGKAMD